MKFIITAHPIDRKLQEELNIYTHSDVKSERVGEVLITLIENGHTTIHAEVNDEKTETRIHCAKR